MGIVFRGHDLRRTAATNMTSAGIPRLTVKRILISKARRSATLYFRNFIQFRKSVAKFYNREYPSSIYYPRMLDIAGLTAHRSVFLLGPRQTGKATYLHERFPDARYFDLLEADTFRELSARPELLRTTLKKDDHIVVIDEIQKLAVLIDEVHLLIERDKRRRFILTVSSARKLKRGSANLLAGRALVAHINLFYRPN